MLSATSNSTINYFDIYINKTYYSEIHLVIEADIVTRNQVFRLQ